MKAPLYPLRFEPVYEKTSWAGSLLHGYLKPDSCRGVPPAATGVSWELVDNAEMRSVVGNGALSGTSISDLVSEFPKEIVGRRHAAGRPFPLCVRLLNVGHDMPLTVHPDRPVSCAAGTAGPNNKFWFSLASEKNGQIIVGIGQGVTRLRVVECLNSSALRELLQVFRPLPGDAFFIPNRRVHGIGAGNLVWELQESAVSALRVSDWTPDAAAAESGQAEALQAIYFQDRQLGRISREAGKVVQTRKIPLVQYCPRFVVDEIRLRDHIFDRTDGASFHLLGVAQGAIEIHTDAGVEKAGQGSVVCVPAALGSYRVYVHGETANLLRVTLQGVR